MNLPPEIASRTVDAGSINPGPGRPTTSFGLNGLTVSSAVHAALAVLGIAIGASESARLSMPSGHSSSQQTLTLSAAFSPPQETLTVLQPPGVETAPRTAPPEPVEAVDPVERLRPVEVPRPAPPPPAPRGQPQAAPPAPAAPPVSKEPPPNEASATAASEAAPAPSSDDTPGAQIEHTARPLPTNHPPVYPLRAQAENREGRAILRVVVDRLGAASQVTLMKSSGHEDLDAAAIAAVSSWRFAPALRHRRPVEQTIAVPIRFVNRR